MQTHKSRTYAKVTTDFETMHRFFQSLTPLLDEVRFKITPDMIQAGETDSGNVAGVTSTLTKSHADEWETETEMVGVNVSQVIGAMEHFPREDVTLEIDADEDNIRLSCGRAVYTAGLIGTETFKRDWWPESKPALKYPASASLNAPAFRSGLLAVAEAPTQHVKIRIIDGGELGLRGENKSGTTALMWSFDEDEARPSGSAQALYTADYLRDIAKGLPNRGGVKVEMDDEHPCRISSGGVEYMIAPRVGSD